MTNEVSKWPGIKILRCMICYDMYYAERWEKEEVSFPLAKWRMKSWLLPWFGNEKPAWLAHVVTQQSLLGPCFIPPRAGSLKLCETQWRKNILIPKKDALNHSLNLDWEKPVDMLISLTQWYYIGFVCVMPFFQPLESIRNCFAVICF